MAAQENHVEIVTLLLESGANSSLTSIAGYTPLQVASQMGHTDCAASLENKTKEAKEKS